VAATGSGGPHEFSDALATAQQNAGAGERVGAARGGGPGEMDVDLAGADLAHQLRDAVSPAARDGGPQRQPQRRRARELFRRNRNEHERHGPPVSAHTRVSGYPASVAGLRTGSPPPPTRGHAFAGTSGRVEALMRLRATRAIIPRR